MLAESDYRGAFTKALARFRRRALIVVFTDLVEQAVGESLLPALPLLVRHHVVLIAAVKDPDVVGWATDPPAGAGEAYRAAAAPLALADRDRATARLRSLGAIVVDEPRRAPRPPPGRHVPRAQGPRAGCRSSSSLACERSSSERDRCAYGRRSLLLRTRRSRSFAGGGAPAEPLPPTPPAGEVGEAMGPRTEMGSRGDRSHMRDPLPRE